MAFTIQIRFYLKKIDQGIRNILAIASVALIFNVKTTYGVAKKMAGASSSKECMSF